MAWKGILDNRDLLIQGMLWIVGNGTDIRFWTFNWAFSFPLINLISTTNRISIDIDENVSDYIVNGCWNVNKLSVFLDHDTVNSILSIPLPALDSRDEFVWGPTSSGIFSVLPLGFNVIWLFPFEG
ncbi:hypothetical protein RchiOBHm_Chr4g0418351 [Rosa chinensis]|uniref:Reverse transcriptase zinc-binding domain-containing protein n=1 Tax=Rosa chinensis TaxID=74649 RepID=A0A2P6QXE4_ROSCH|nr:hypothetical protein RchiOBHm_Chr4g0418351 [Rosa chinensis]